MGLDNVALGFLGSIVYLGLTFGKYSILSINLSRIPHGNTDLLLSKSKVYFSNLFHHKRSCPSALYRHSKFLPSSFVSFLSRFLPGNNIQSFSLFLDLHMHLFSCMGGYFRDSTTKNDDALSFTSRTSLGSSHRIHPNSCVYSSSQLAMGFLHLGVNRCSAYIVSIIND